MLAIAAFGVGCADVPAQPNDPGLQAPPLHGLPSAEGAHIARIKAINDGAWLALGAPAPDPKWGSARGRAWGGRALILASGIRGAFFYGEGVHAFVKPDGRLMDDLWFYDINAHRWIAVYPGTDTTTFTARVKRGDLRINEDGQLADAGGQPIPVHALIHAWDLLAFDSTLRRFAFGPGVPRLPGRYFLGGLPLMEDGLKLLEGQRAQQIFPPLSPYFYDLVSGKFVRHAVNMSYPSEFDDFPYFQYVPSQRQYLLLGSRGVAAYEPTAAVWSRVNVTGSAPPGYDHGGCYDSKRDRIYLGAGAPDPTGALFIYEVKTASWSKPASKGTPPQSFRTNDASISYDVANDVVTVFHYADNAIYTWVLATDTWSKQALPSALVTATTQQSFHAFYDPALNAYFVYSAADSDDRGVMWVHRYKK